MVVFDPIKSLSRIIRKGTIARIGNNPEDENAGMREIPFSNELYRREDFMEIHRRNIFV